MLDKTNLHPYQLRAAEYIIDKGSAMLAIDCGLGKTVITLTALEMMLSFGMSQKILILGPPRVAAHVWSEEAVKWSHTKHLKVAPLIGTPNNRTRLLGQKSDVYTMSYDLLPWLVEMFGKNSWPFDTVILDESSMVKNHGTRRFKSLRKVRGRIDRVICLSGTPAANTLMSLWSQFWLIDQGKRLGKTFTGFRDRYYTSDYRGWSWELRPGADKQIHDAIDDLSISMSAEDYLQLPDLIVNRVAIYLPTKVKDQYRELEREFLISISRETEITAINSAV
ncbi:MAG: ATP-dependent helicase, partial [Gammaproteobacteria bacterium]|nr:ATP-dependent helicase [Gammaproteobacteria bacterium]